MKLPQPSMFKKRFMLISLCLGLLGTTTEGQEYNLTGSSKYAVLGKDFTWTCGMFVPPGEATKGVRFFRNNVLCAIVEHTNGICLYGVQNTRYTYGCSSPFSYILTIPAENMTEYEEGSMWLCQYSFDLGVRFRSLVVTLHLAVDVHNVSLIPSDNPMTLAEGVYYMVRCVVNSNAVPAPTITWYMGSTDITNMAGSNASSIIITVNREHNNRTLECKATNNNKPSKTGATTLNVEYPPSVIPLTQKETKEGQDFLISCRATPGNPITTMFWWIKVNDPVFKQNGSTLQLPYIQRHNSGTYKCIAENTYSNGWKGTDSQEMVVNVLYIQTTSNTRNQTWEVVGSVAGVLIVLTLAIVLSCFVHRHFTLICNIGFQRRSTHVKTADLIEEKSNYTAMSEQETENERNPYDVLSPTESSNQYEAIQMKESQKTDANTYECLNKPENITPCDNPTKDSNKPGILKKTDATSSSNTEEYTNTSFVN
ncbi:uncharacterized protein LOC144617641 isoform X1 [Crassostrea virginica]